MKSLLRFGASFVFRNPRLDQFLHQRQRQRFLRRELDRPFADLEAFQFLLKLQRGFTAAG